MSSTKKIIAVIGATGGQGGSVVKAILGDAKMNGSWAVRGVTRDASKESSKQLVTQGAEVVEVSDTSNPNPSNLNVDLGVIGRCKFNQELDKGLPRGVCCVCSHELLGEDGHGA